MCARSICSDSSALRRACGCTRKNVTVATDWDYPRYEAMVRRAASTEGGTHRGGVSRRHILPQDCAVLQTGNSCAQAPCPCFTARPPLLIGLAFPATPDRYGTATAP